MSFNNECLQAHNEYRAKHGVPPLKYNAQLSVDATRFAQQLLREGALRSSNVSDLGENIYSVRSTDPNYTISGEAAVNHWYNKESEHDYSCEPPENNPTGNFTQVVWKDSRELAIGLAQEGGRVIVVTRYSPPGNVRGQFCANVLPPMSSGIRRQVCPQGPPQPTCVRPSAASTPRSNGASSSGNFNRDCLNQHNMYRAKHGVPALQLDDQLCRYSQEWAEELARRGVMQHRSQNTYGENIFSAWSSDPNYTVEGGKAVDSWYDEIQFYTFGQEPRDLKAGHFTQVVWRLSEKLGVGIAKKNGHIYVVCNYSPPGNYVGNYTPNVPAPL
ncbi:uncharacterized protein [Atheta coriaria]|uniref:uncharacterized protein n=1 Tax=Dalotia coriaria TaxID=877792 RepID=UPI0031F34F2F